MGGGIATPEDTDDKTAAFVKQYQLTLCEVDVLALLVTGKTNAQIAIALSLSKKCIEHHLHDLYGKLGVKIALKCHSLRVEGWVCCKRLGFP